MPRPFRAPCGRAVGWTAVVLSLAMISLFVLPMSPSSLIEAEWAILIGWSALGALFYGHALRRHGIGTMRRRMQETLDAPEG
jgi:peptidoglycan biosynthesis protein MviN/MurJ (putative lipid II flippase)